MRDRRHRLPAHLVCFVCLRETSTAGGSCAALPRRPSGGSRPDRAVRRRSSHRHLAHRLAVDRALAAIEIVHDKIRQMQASGGMKQVSSAFKVACVVTPSARYRDHLGAFKLSWSKQMAAAMGLIHGFQI